MGRSNRGQSRNLLSPLIPPILHRYEGVAAGRCWHDDRDGLTPFGRRLALESQDRNLFDLSGIETRDESICPFLLLVDRPSSLDGRVNSHTVTVPATTSTAAAIHETRRCALYRSITDSLPRIPQIGNHELP